MLSHCHSSLAGILWCYCDDYLKKQGPYWALDYLTDGALEEGRKMWGPVTEESSFLIPFQSFSRSLFLWGSTDQDVSREQIGNILGILEKHHQEREGRKKEVLIICHDEGKSQLLSREVSQHGVFHPVIFH